MTTAARKRRRRRYELSEEEGRALFDREALRLLGMSGDEFLAKYDAGEIDVDDPSIHSAAIKMEMLLPFVREVYPRR